MPLLTMDHATGVNSFYEKMCEYRNFSKLFKIIQKEKSNDICIADEVEYVDRLITYKGNVI